MSVDRLLLPNRVAVYNNYKKRPFKERYNFVNNRINTLMQDPEKNKITPSKKLITKYVGPKVQCMTSPNSAVMLDSNDFYHYAMTRFGEFCSQFDYEYNSLEFVSYLVRITNEYFGKLPTEAEYKAFTQGKIRSINDFKGNNKASVYERALVMNNFAQIMGFESNLAFTDKGPALMMEYDDILNLRTNKLEPGYIVAFPGVYSYAHKGNDTQIMPAFSLMVPETVDEFLHRVNWCFDTKDFTDKANVEQHIPGYTIENPKKLHFDFGALGLTSLQSFERKVNTQQQSQEHTR